MPFNPDLARWAIDQTVGLLRDSFNAAQSGGPEFIATGEPTSLIGKINQSAMRATCRRWARVKDNLSEDRNAAYATTCQPYLESIGEWPGNPSAETPFSGGQCPGKSYRVRVRRQFAISPSLAFPEYILNGPIGGISSVGVGSGNSAGRQWFLTHGGTPGQANPLSLGATFNQICSGSPPVCQPNPGAYTIESITPITGTDDCGNPPVVYEPSEPVTGPLPPTTVIDTDFSVDIDVQIGPGGDLVITFDPGSSDPVSGPGDPFADPDGGGGVEPLVPGDRGDPGDDFDSGDGVPEGEAPPGKVLTGVLLELISAGSGVNKTDNGDFVVYRGVAYVFMGGDPGVDLQPEGSTVIFPQFFEAPENSTKWKVCVNNGYRLRVTPYYKDVEES